MGTDMRDGARSGREGWSAGRNWDGGKKGTGAKEEVSHRTEVHKNENRGIQGTKEAEEWGRKKKIALSPAWPDPASACWTFEPSQINSTQALSGCSCSYLGLHLGSATVIISTVV